MNQSITKDSLFGPSIDGVCEEDYTTIVPQVIQTAKAFETTCFQKFMIADFHKRELIFVSKKALKYYSDFDDIEDFRDMILSLPKGFSLKAFETFLEKKRDFYNHLSKEEKLNYSCSYTLEHEWKGFSFCLHHREKPIMLSRTGKIWLVLYLSFPSTPTNDYPIFMEYSDCGIRYFLDLKQKKWMECKFNVLNEKEQLMVRMSLEGATIQSIAFHLGMSEDGVKAIRRRLFGIHQVKNMQELILKLMNSHMVQLSYFHKDQ